jgi:hypothetical protein
VTIPTKPAISETQAETFARWLLDGETWIGIFENHDLGHPDRGRRVALPFDTSVKPPEPWTNMRAPDHPSIGLGWRYVLVAICTNVHDAVQALKETP